MTPPITLYAWRRPAFVPEDEWLEHTYVTDYEPYDQYKSIYDVILHSHNFWYCWGAFDLKTQSHILVNWPTGGVSADLNKVNCICIANAPGEHGTIDIYGIEGACHQVTNQVLYPSSPRQSVKGVRGWQLSYFLYGAYGRNPAWDQLKNKCAPDVSQMMAHPSGEQYIMKVDTLRSNLTRKGVSHKMIDDEELDHFISEQLGYNISLEIRSLLHKHREDIDNKGKEIYSKMKAGEITPEEFANQLNELHKSQLEEIAKAIGPDKFNKLFGSSLEKVVKLIDPRVASGLFKKIEKEGTKKLDQ